MVCLVQEEAQAVCPVQEEVPGVCPVQEEVPGVCPVREEAQEACLVLAAEAHFGRAGREGRAVQCRAGRSRKVDSIEEREFGWTCEYSLFFFIL